MNLKSLFLVGGLVSVIGVSSFNQPFKNANAALTAPTSWTFKYTNQDAPGFKLRNSTSVITTPTYVRTADSTYFNYTSTFTITNGLTATQTFNRSNSTWAFDAASGNYIPSAAAVGSDNTVGTIEKKIDLIFNNQTNKDYRLYLDFSTTGINRSWVYKINNNIIVSGYSDNRFFNEFSVLTSIYVPSFSNTNFYMYSNGLQGYLDAWYLQDLGVSPAYESGVDDGIIQGEQSADSTVLLDAVETVVGVAINFILMIMTFSIFDISLLNIALVLVAVLGIIWILKALRG